MQSQPDSVEDEHSEIADSIRTGEYFRKARAMYDLSVHDLMAERYLYVFISLVALLIFLIAFSAMRALYPLSIPVPFIFNSTDIIDDIPHMQSLIEHKGEDPGAALLRFFVNNYVVMREEYNIDTFDRNVTGVQSQSSPTVFSEFSKAVDPRNPESPLALYQRYSKRAITIVSLRQVEKDKEIEVIYEATVEGKGEIKKSRWQTNITFQYSGLTLDEKTRKAKPVSFVVTQYHTKRLQDIK